MGCARHAAGRSIALACLNAVRCPLPTAVSAAGRHARRLGDSTSALPAHSWPISLTTSNSSSGRGVTALAAPWMTSRRAEAALCQPLGWPAQLQRFRAACTLGFVTTPLPLHAEIQGLTRSTGASTIGCMNPQDCSSFCHSLPLTPTRMRCPAPPAPPALPCTSVGAGRSRAGPAAGARAAPAALGTAQRWRPGPAGGCTPNASPPEQAAWQAGGVPP